VAIHGNFASVSASLADPEEILRRLCDALRQKVFPHVLSYLQKQPSVNEANLDKLVLDFLSTYRNLTLSGYTIQFLPPYDPAYRPDTGRTHHDFVCKGLYRPTSMPVTIWVNDKLGNLDTPRRNDVTTYNNLLRLYLEAPHARIRTPSLPPNATDAILRRLKNQELVAYGILAIDRSLNEYSFFLLEEIEGPLYINPRNTMLQVSYRPKLRQKPQSYKDFILSLLEAIQHALRRTQQSVESELESLEKIRQDIESIAKENR